MTKVGVVIPCHNDGKYLGRALASVKAAMIYSGQETGDIIVVLDRCTDNSLEVASSMLPQGSIFIKRTTSWKNSIPENLDIGFKLLISRGCDRILVVDADMVIPEQFITSAVRVIESTRCDAVSSVLYAEPSSTYNRIYHGYELVMEKVGFNKKYRQHGHRLYNVSSALADMDSSGNIFTDALAADSSFDRRGHSIKVMSLITWHIRETGLRKTVRNQIWQGRAMRQVGKKPRQVIGEVGRLRGLVFLSYVLSHEKMPARPD